MNTFGTINKVTLIGYVGGEVKIHYFSQDACVARFTIATNDTYINKENQSITITDWHNIVASNKLAELCEEYLSKGDKIYVEGKLSNRVWQTEQGETKRITEIKASQIVFLSVNKTTNPTNTKRYNNDEFQDFEIPKI